MALMMHVVKGRQYSVVLSLLRCRLLNHGDGDSTSTVTNFDASIIETNSTSLVPRSTLYLGLWAERENFCTDVYP